MDIVNTFDHCNAVANASICELVNSEEFKIEAVKWDIECSDNNLGSQPSRS